MDSRCVDAEGEPCWKHVECKGKNYGWKGCDHANGVKRKHTSVPLDTLVKQLEDDKF